jgi:hypothetical protein
MHTVNITISLSEKWNSEIVKLSDLLMQQKNLDASV